MLTGRTSRGRERTRLAALLAILALLVQALLPAAAMAAQAHGAVSIEICTDQGAKTVVIGADGKAHKAFMGLPCQDCLAMTMAATMAPDLAVQHVAYAAQRVVHAYEAERAVKLARAPPRPPGQGPPAETA